MAMKNTPFKMNGFSGFGNSPLKDTDPHTSGHTHNTIVSPDLSSGGLMRSRGGGPRPKTKKRRGSGWWRRTGRKATKIINSLLPGSNESVWAGNVKIGCGPRGCGK